MTQDLRIEKLTQTSRWAEVDAEQAERLISLAVAMDQKRGDQWAPVTREELLLGLSRNAEPRYGTEWYMKIRRVHEISPETMRAAAEMEERVAAEDRRLDALDDD